jgi:ankyrin repeat protein
VNHQNNDGETALIWTSKEGRTNIVVELLKHDKVDVNHQNNDNETALISGRSKKAVPNTVVQVLKVEKCGCESPR